MKGRPNLRQSCDTSMRSARSGDCVLPRAGARICEANHRGLEGEDWVQYACEEIERGTQAVIERGTHAHRASKLGPVER